LLMGAGYKYSYLLTYLLTYLLILRILNIDEIINMTAPQF